MSIHAKNSTVWWTCNGRFWGISDTVTVKRNHKICSMRYGVLFVRPEIMLWQSTLWLILPCSLGTKLFPSFDLSGISIFLSETRTTSFSWRKLPILENRDFTDMRPSNVKNEYCMYFDRKCRSFVGCGDRIFNQNSDVKYKSVIHAWKLYIAKPYCDL